MSIILLVLASLVAAFIFGRSRSASLAMVFLGLVLFTPSQAFAATETLSSVQLSPLTISLVIGLLIPLVTGLITKYSTSSGVKGLITLILNAVQSLIVTATVSDGTALISKETFVAFALSLTISIATYAGVYRPQNVTSSKPDGALARVGPKD